MSDTSLNKYLGQGDDAAEAAYTPSPVTGTTPEQAVLYVNAEDPVHPRVDWWDGAAFVSTQGANGAAYLLYQDQQAQNTNGGTFTSGAWRTRVLNTEVADTGNNGTLASNQITLLAGTYAVTASSHVFAVDRNQMRLQNITDGTTAVVGESCFTRSTLADSGGSAHLMGFFTIAGTKTFELQHQCQTTQATFGLGVACNFTTEVFASIEFWKIA